MRHWSGTTWAAIPQGLPLERMSGGELAVYVVLAEHARYTTGLAAVGNRTIASRTGLSTRQVRRCLRTLEALGLLTTTRPGRGRLPAVRQLLRDTDVPDRGDTDVPPREDMGVPSTPLGGTFGARREDIAMSPKQSNKEEERPADDEARRFWIGEGFRRIHATDQQAAES